MTIAMRDPAYLGVTSAAEGETLVARFVLIPRDRAAQKNVRALDLFADRHSEFHKGARGRFVRPACPLVVLVSKGAHQDIRKTVGLNANLATRGEA